MGDLERIAGDIRARMGVLNRMHVEHMSLDDQDALRYLLRDLARGVAALLEREAARG